MKKIIGKVRTKYSCLSQKVPIYTAKILDKKLYRKYFH